MKDYFNEIYEILSDNLEIYDEGSDFFPTIEGIDSAAIEIVEFINKLIKETKQQEYEHYNER